MSDIRAVLLDIDGTLVDSNDAHARAWQQALAHHGHDIPFARLRALIGKGGDKLLAEAVGINQGSPHGQAIDELRTQLFTTGYLPRLRACPGARQLLLRMREAGQRLVVATSAKQAELTALLEVAGVRDLIDASTTSDQAERSKPDPDIVAAALSEARVPPGAALMLGDTPYDVEAAARCGVKTVAVRSGGWSDAELSGALAIYADAADLLAHYDESPFATSAQARA